MVPVNLKDQPRVNPHSGPIPIPGFLFAVLLPLNRYIN
jgi:hypothetical protein